MNYRDRFLNAIRRNSVDKIPKHALFSPELIKKIKEETGGKDPDDYFKTEARWEMMAPFTHSPKLEEHFKYLKENGRTKKVSSWGDWDEKKHGKKTIDEWGVYRDYGSYYHFAKMFHTMADLENVNDLKNWPWPIIDEKFCNNLKEKVKRYKNENIATVSFYGCLFEQAWYLRGMEKLLVDFYFNKKFAGYLLDKITELNCIAVTKLISCGIDVFYTGDDVSTQQDLMMSIDMWRKWIKNRTKIPIDKIKKIKSDALILYHSDGNNYKILGDLIEIGCDVLHPIQPECMDVIKVHKEYGKDVAFWGTIGTQKLMPFGTPKEVKNEVRRIIHEFDAFNGGLIIAPTHYLEPDVPWENIIAFFNTVEDISNK